MRAPAPTLLAPLLLALLASSPAHANITRGESSLEIRMADANAVLRVRVIADGGERLQLAVLESYRGGADLAEILVYDSDHFFPAPRDAQDREFLILLATNGRALNHWRPTLVLPLDGLLAKYSARSMDLTIPRTRDQILRAVREGVADLPPDGENCPRLAITCNRLFPDFEIPATDRARRLALEWAKSPDPDRRKNAVEILPLFNSPQSIAALQSLLADSHLESRVFRSGPRKVYSLRLAALRALRQLDAAYSEPALESPHWTWSFVAGHPLGLSLALVTLVLTPLAFMFARHRRRRRGLYLERWRPRRAVFGGAALASTLVAATCAFHWYWGRIDGKIFLVTRPTGLTWALKSAHGKLQLLWTSAAAADRTVIDWGPDGRDYEQEMTTAPYSTMPGAFAKSPGLGFLYATTDSLQGSFVPTPFGGRVSMLQAPFAFPLFLASLPTLLWLGHHHRHTRRRRRRADHGQCLACGYDLRHSPTRCPECGLSRGGAPERPARTSRQ